MSTGTLVIAGLPARLRRRRRTSCTAAAAPTRRRGQPPRRRRPDRRSRSSSTTARTNVKKMKEMLKNTEKVVEQFHDYPGKTQVPLERAADQPVPPAPAKADGQAATRPTRRRATQARGGARWPTLKAVGSAASSSRSSTAARSKACMINNTLYREGQQVDAVHDREDQARPRDREERRVPVRAEDAEVTRDDASVASPRDDADEGSRHVRTTVEHDVRTPPDRRARRSPTPPGDGARRRRTTIEPLWQPARRRGAQERRAAPARARADHRGAARPGQDVQSQTPGKSLAQILLTMNAASEAQILSALAETLGMRVRDAGQEPGRRRRRSSCSRRTTSASTLVLPLRFENEQDARRRHDRPDQRLPDRRGHAARSRSDVQGRRHDRRRHQPARRAADDQNAAT